MPNKREILVDVLYNIKAIDHCCYSMAHVKMSKEDVLEIVYEIEKYLIEEIRKCENAQNYNKKERD